MAATRYSQLPMIAPMHGEDHYAARLTEADVRLIRALGEERSRLLQSARKLSNATLAEKFDVSVRTIERVLDRSRWGHVE